MRVSFLFLTLVMMIASGAVAAPAQSAGVGGTADPQTAAAEPATTSPTIGATHGTADADIVQHLPRISVVETRALEQKTDKWQTAHGCDNREPGLFSAPLTKLQSKAETNDLTAEGEFGLRLIIDGEGNHRTEGETWLRRAMEQGSVCAIFYDATVGFRARHGRRDPVNSGKLKLRGYRVIVPEPDAAKRLAIMNGYAWDFLYEMRSGVPVSYLSAAHIREDQFKFKFQPTPAEWEYACKRANVMYRSLQSEREAKGLAPFDDSPPPTRPVFAILIAAFHEVGQHHGQAKFLASHPAAGTAWAEHTVFKIAHNQQLTKVGQHCSNWPGPKPEWQLAISHYIRKNGKIGQALIWIAGLPTPELKAGTQ